MPSFSPIRIASLVLLASSSVFAAPIMERQLANSEGLSGISPLGLGHGPVCPGGVCPSEGVLKRQLSDLEGLSGISPLGLGHGPVCPGGVCPSEGLLKRQDPPTPTPAPTPVALPSSILQELKTQRISDCSGTIEVCDPQANPAIQPIGTQAIGTLLKRQDPPTPTPAPTPAPSPSGIFQELKTLSISHCDGSLQVCDPKAFPGGGDIASLF